jgi:hypothetical protein
MEENYHGEPVQKIATILATIAALFDAVAQAGNDGRHQYRASRAI